MCLPSRSQTSIAHHGLLPKESEGGAKDWARPHLDPIDESKDAISKHFVLRLWVFHVANSYIISSLPADRRGTGS